MTRPTEEIIDDMDAAEVGAHGCLLPTDDAESGFSEEEAGDE